MPKQYSEEFKRKIIQRYEKGESIKELSQEFHIAQSTIYHWRKLFCSIQTSQHTYTPKEFDVLALLLEAHGKPVATSELYEKVWGEQFLASSANSVMVHIRHLRTKLSKLDSDQVFIETVWGVGYKIAPYGT